MIVVTVTVLQDSYTLASSSNGRTYMYGMQTRFSIYYMMHCYIYGFCVFSAAVTIFTPQIKGKLVYLYIMYHKGIHKASFIECKLLV